MKKLLLAPLVLALSCGNSESRPRGQRALDLARPHLIASSATLHRDGDGFFAGAGIHAPHVANGALRITVFDATLDVFAEDLTDAKGVADGATVVYAGAARDLDLLEVLGPSRVEEARVLWSPAAPHRARYRLEWSPRIASVRVVDRRIEAIDLHGRVLIAAAPPFAIDASGTRRDVDVTWIDAHHVELALDGTGLTYPIVVDPAWSATPSMARKRKDFAAVLLDRARVLVIGGDDGVGAVSACEIYNIATNTWGATGALVTNRRGHAAARLATGRVLVFGGDTTTSGGSSVLSSAEVYDPATSRWTTTGSTPSYVFDPMLAVAGDGRGVLVSGSFTAEAGTHLYNPLTGTWTVGASAGTTSAAGLVALSSGLVLRLRSSGTAGPDHLFDPKTNAWTAVGTRTTVRTGPTVVKLASDRVLVAGGRTPGFGGTPLSSADIFDPTTRTWSSAGSMRVARSGAFGAPIGPSALVGGGSNADAELFDPITKVWRTGTPMVLTDPRTDAQAIPIATGKVLVMGGAIPGGTTSTAEIFDVGAAGDLCSADGDCLSGFCVDGVCCDRACSAQCEACDVPTSVGTCTTVLGPPHGTRARCDIGDGSICARTTCDGMTATSCAKRPDALVKCSPASCDGSSYAPQGTCDGMGKCTPAAKLGCGDYSCDTEGCKTSCITRADCAGGLVCLDGKCTKRLSQCSSDGLSAAGESGSTACSPYRCDEATGTCAKSCEASAECAPGFVCDATSSTCASAPTAPATEDEGGCAMGRATSSTSTLLLATLFALTRARRRTR